MLSLLNFAFTSLKGRGSGRDSVFLCLLIVVAECLTLVSV